MLNATTSSKHFEGKVTGASILHLPFKVNVRFELFVLLLSQQIPVLRADVAPSNSWYLL